MNDLLIKKKEAIINKFCELSSLKYSILDEYGDFDENALIQEKQRCITKIANLYGITQKFMDNLFLEMSESEINGHPRPLQISQMGQYLRYSIGQINKDDVDDAYELVRLYFFELDNLFKKYLKSHKRSEIINPNFNGMTGVEFEGYISSVLKMQGFEVSGTPVTGDQGADIIASNKKAKYIIQAKRYTETVGNKAIQEVVAAKNYYQGDIAVVVTNSLFTPSAKKLAQKNKVILIDKLRINDIGSVLS